MRPTRVAASAPRGRNGREHFEGRGREILGGMRAGARPCKARRRIGLVKWTNSCRTSDRSAYLFRRSSVPGLITRAPWTLGSLFALIGSAANRSGKRRPSFRDPEKALHLLNGEPKTKTDGPTMKPARTRLLCRGVSSATHSVMAGLVPAIPQSCGNSRLQLIDKTKRWRFFPRLATVRALAWMAGTSPAMTVAHLPGICDLANYAGCSQALEKARFGQGNCKDLFGFPSAFS